MTIETNAGAYLRSISEELRSKANRVRNLIGAAHFLTDGHHKEYLLSSVIERFLPQGIVCARGFVVRDHNLSVVSKEQDLLLVDVRASAPLFYESGVIVTFPENVRAAVSVKSTLNSSTLTDAIAGLNSIPRIESAISPWFGVYSFQRDSAWNDKAYLALKWAKSRLNEEELDRSLKDWSYGAICCDSGVYLRMTNTGEPSIRGYNTPLATALFIAALIQDIQPNAPGDRGLGDLLAGAEFEEICNP